MLNDLKYHVDYENRGILWCGVARETREPHVTIGRLLPKENIFSDLPAFQDLNGSQIIFLVNFYIKKETLLIFLQLISNRIASYSKLF